MSLNLAAIQLFFKRIGKYLNIGVIADGQSTVLKTAVAGASAQELTATVDGFNVLTQATNPLAANVKTVTNGLDGLDNQVLTAVTNLLRQVVAVDLGLAAGTAVGTVNTALVASMVAASASVAASGDAGFADYFYENFSTVLPQSGSPNIQDAWIETAVA